MSAPVAIAASAVFWLNLAAAAGIAILSVPVFALNFRKKKLAAIAGIVARRAETGDSAALDRVARALEERRRAQANNWRQVDEWCLYAGYALLLGSAVLRLFVPAA